METIKVNAPDFSIGDKEGGATIRVDSGKFMETVFELVEETLLDGTPRISYYIDQIVINGILRQLDTVDESDITDLTESVVRPIFSELAEQIKEAE